LLFSGEDPVEAAKEFQAQVKANDKLSIKAGYFEGDLLDGKGVEMVSKLPSREEMLVTVLRTIQEPGRQTLGVLQAPARDLLYLLNNFANKLEGEG
jgi:large subunit ribosomal protein L10